MATNVLVSKNFYTYNSGIIGESINDFLYCTKEQKYKINPFMSSEYHFDVVQGVTTTEYSGGDVTLTVTPNAHGRCALLYDDSNVNALVVDNRNTVRFSYIIFKNGEAYSTVTNSSQYPEGGNQATIGECVFSTNIPIFRTLADEDAYLNAATEEDALTALNNALNLMGEKYNPETTDLYVYSVKQSSVTLERGTVTPSGSATYHTLLIQANAEPAFYIVEGTFEMRLITSSILASVHAAGPLSVAENIPQTQWTDYALAWNGPFYTTMGVYEERFKELPNDGTYTYPIEYQTNIPVFKTEAEARNAIETGDYSDALKFGPVNRKEYDVKIGDEETITTFGGGGFISPFMTILSGSKTDLHRLADLLFTDDDNLWDDISKGLRMYGSNPIDYIISCRAFGFDVGNVTTQSPRNDIWFGSYRHHFDVAFNEVINLAHKFIDAGSFFMAPIQYNYLDLEPYTELSAYFPYLGWEKLDMKKYYQRTVNVRYYVDILTGQGLIVTTCDGVLCDQFGPFEMGTELPLTGANYAQWAQGQVRLLAQSAQSITGGISQGISSGNVAGFAANTLSSLIPASLSLMEARQQGGPKNTAVTKGNFGSNIGNYLPGYVMFRFDIHEMFEPSLLTELNGKPSYSSGTVRNFSGFLSGKVVKMDTTGMSDAEADRIRGLLLQGIYV